MIDRTLPPDCRDFHRALGGGLDVDPAKLAMVESHAAACSDCARFRAHLGSMDRLGERASRARLAPAPDARERLHASWQHLAVRSSFRDWLKYWLSYEIGPKVMRPLAPHAAMIFGFIFFSFSLIQIQINTGWLTPSPVADRHFQMSAARLTEIISPVEGEAAPFKSGEIPIDAA